MNWIRAGLPVRQAGGMLAMAVVAMAIGGAAPARAQTMAPVGLPAGQAGLSAEARPVDMPGARIAGSLVDPQTHHLLVYVVPARPVGGPAPRRHHWFRLWAARLPAGKAGADPQAPGAWMTAAGMDGLARVALKVAADGTLATGADPGGPVVQCSGACVVIGGMNGLTPVALKVGADGTVATSGGGGGSSAFSAITGGTNTAAAMVVGSGASLAASGTGTIVPTSLPAGDCKLASSLGFLLNDTDETTLFQTTMNNFQSNGGGCLVIDANKTLGVFGQIVLTNSGATLYNQSPIRITGVTPPDMSAVANPTGPATKGSILDLRYASASVVDGQIISLGQGTFEIDHLQVVNNGTACATMLYSTNTNVKLHDDAFKGSTSNSGSSACMDVWVAGGFVFSSPILGTNTDIFQGYGSVFENNFGDYVRRMVFGRGSFNSINVRGNTVWSNSGSSLTRGAPYQLDGGSAVSPFGVNFVDNLTEIIHYSCGFSLNGNDGTHGAGVVNGTLFIGNSFWDNSAPTAYCADSSAVTRSLILQTITSPTTTFNAGWNQSSNTIIDATGSSDTKFGWGVDFKNKLYFGGVSSSWLQSIINNSSDTATMVASVITNGTAGLPLCTDANSGATTSGCGVTGAYHCVATTPVSQNANVTTDQNLQACTLPTGLLNSANKTLRIHTAGTYSTAAASTAAITMKVLLCTVNGCGSGVVVPLCNITTSALGAITVSNDTWYLDCLASTKTAGASSTYERSGNLAIDLLLSNAAADTVFLDPNATAVTSPTIDSTAQLFLQVTGAYSAGSTSNLMVGRQLIIESIN